MTINQGKQKIKSIRKRMAVFLNQEQYTVNDLGNFM